jgi:diguanylate cyclase (GGDEF)-like protein
MKILLADASPKDLALLSSSLSKSGHVIIAAKNSKEVITLFNKEHPDLIILNVIMKGIDGLECAKQIRAIDSDDWTPILFLSDEMNDTSIVRWMDAGGDDYLTKPVNEIHLNAKIKTMQRIADRRKKIMDLTDKLSTVSMTDSLTGLYNHLQFDTSIKVKVAEAYRYNDKLALFLMDLDNFKKFNDKYGHQIGDLLLQQVAGRLTACLRENDFIAHLGSDEFAIIITRLRDVIAIEKAAQKVIRVISQPYLLDGTETVISASMGIAVYPTLGMSCEDLIRKADSAMGHVKKTGRNNFAFYSEGIY